MKKIGWLVVACLLCASSCASERELCYSGDDGAGGRSYEVQFLCSTYATSQPESQNAASRRDALLTLCAAAVVRYAQCADEKGGSRIAVSSRQ